jgi:[ribosomal protein S5]-alanine N-acetyltransferase
LRVKSSQLLESERLLLEPLCASHASLLYACLLDDRLYRYIPQDPTVSEHALRERYCRLEARRSPDGREVWLNWAMRLPGTTTYIGTLEATVYPDQTAHVAYMVFPSHQGHGYATEGLHRILSYLVTHHRVHTIVAEIDTRNTASVALVERLGFVRVATVRDADFFKGTASDEYRYELETRQMHALISMEVDHG